MNQKRVFYGYTQRNENSIMFNKQTRKKIDRFLLKDNVHFTHTQHSNST